MAARGPLAHPCVRALHVLGLLLAGTRRSSARLPATRILRRLPPARQRTPSRPILSAVCLSGLPLSCLSGSREPRCQSEARRLGA